MGVENEDLREEGRLSAKRELALRENLGETHL
jgi:hypothetical protein